MRTVKRKKYRIFYGGFNAYPATKDGDNMPGFGGNTPLGRAGQPTELAPAYVFLASAESSYVIGETLNVNGGIPSP